MQSKTIMLMVLSFGVAFALLAGSGIGPAVFGESPGGAQTTKTVGDVAGDADIDPDSEGEGLSADVAGDNEPTLVGVAISGGQFVAQLVAMVTIFPYTLLRLGFPAYFAVPIGSVAQIIVFIGLIQFVRGTELI